MSGPKTIFDADECQALLDLFDRFSLDTIDDVVETDEERSALAKLREASKFYVPEAQAWQFMDESYEHYRQRVERGEGQPSVQPSAETGMPANGSKS